MLNSRHAKIKISKLISFCQPLFRLVEARRVELLTSGLQSPRSANWATPPIPYTKLIAGAGFEPTTFGLWAQRATGLLHPALNLLVGLGGFEPPTSRLSGVRSNQLSYRPREQER